MPEAVDEYDNGAASGSTTGRWLKLMADIEHEGETMNAVVRTDAERIYELEEAIRTASIELLWYVDFCRRQKIKTAAGDCVGTMIRKDVMALASVIGLDKTLEA